MKLLVTGGAGFIGSNFIHYWMKNHPDDQVINFDLLTYAGHKESLKDLEDNPHYNFIKGDITNAEDVAKAMKGMEIVVHFAAESHVDRSVLDPMIFIKTNVLGTGILLDQALKHQVKRFHLVSTDEVFGQLGLDDLPFTEKTNYDPRTPYAASKASADHLVKAYFKTYQLPVTITNCSNNYGFFHDPEKLIPRFITNLLEDKKVPLMGKGENVRDWLFVEDHARAIETVLLKGKIGESYCVGGEERSNLVVTKKLLKLLEKDESYIEFVGHRLGHDLRYAIDCAKLKKLGWKPEKSFDQRIVETVNWYKANEWWWKPLKMGRPIVDRISQKTYSNK
jgi:dTDP-glucose 4,6-dehydratase